MLTSPANKMPYRWMIVLLLAISLVFGAMKGPIERHHRNVRLFAAMEANDLNTVQRLLAQGADPNSRYSLCATLPEQVSALLHGKPLTRPIVMPMAYHGRTAIVKVLLEQGLNVNGSEHDGSTALMWAAQQGHADLLHLLLTHNAKVQARDKEGYTALIRATWSGNPVVVAALLDAGSEVDARCKYGHSALSCAVQSNQEIMVALLLKHHAHTNWKDEAGPTVLSLARQHQCGNIVRLLQQVGAKE